MSGSTGNGAVIEGPGVPVGGIHDDVVGTSVAHEDPVMLALVHGTEMEIVVELLVELVVEVSLTVGSTLESGVGFPSQPMESVGRPSGGGTIPPTTASAGITRM